MCIYADWDPPKVEHHSTPRARKPHRCTECSRTIEPGETYLRWDGIDCYGDPYASKMCGHCGATIELGAALTGCPKNWYWDEIHNWRDEEAGFVANVLRDHELRFADEVRMLRLVAQRKRLWRRPNGELYPLPQIPVRAAA